VHCNTKFGISDEEPDIRDEGESMPGGDEEPDSRDEGEPTYLSVIGPQIMLGKLGVSSCTLKP
jgi:hypothetical protein